jgi:hypothetical protein
MLAMSDQFFHQVLKTRISQSEYLIVLTGKLALLHCRQRDQMLGKAASSGAGDALATALVRLRRAPSILPIHHPAWIFEHRRACCRQCGEILFT